MSSDSTGEEKSIVKQEETSTSGDILSDVAAHVTNPAEDTLLKHDWKSFVGNLRAFGTRFSPTTASTDPLVSPIAPAIASSNVPSSPGFAVTTDFTGISTAKMSDSASTFRLPSPLMDDEMSKDSAGDGGDKSENGAGGDLEQELRVLASLAGQNSSNEISLASLPTPEKPAIPPTVPEAAQVTPIPKEPEATNPDVSTSPIEDEKAAKNDPPPADEAAETSDEDLSKEEAENNHGNLVIDTASAEQEQPSATATADISVSSSPATEACSTPTPTKGAEKSDSEATITPSTPVTSLSGGLKAKINLSAIRNYTSGLTSPKKKTSPDGEMPQRKKPTKMLCQQCGKILGLKETDVCNGCRQKKSTGKKDGKIAAKKVVESKTKQKSSAYISSASSDAKSDSSSSDDEGTPIMQRRDVAKVVDSSRASTPKSTKSKVSVKDEERPDSPASSLYSKASSVSTKRSVAGSSKSDAKTNAKKQKIKVEEEEEQHVFVPAALSLEAERDLLAGLVIDLQKLLLPGLPQLNRGKLDFQASQALQLSDSGPPVYSPPAVKSNQSATAVKSNQSAAAVKVETVRRSCQTDPVPEQAEIESAKLAALTTQLDESKHELKAKRKEIASLHDDLARSINEKDQLNKLAISLESFVLQPEILDKFNRSADIPPSALVTYGIESLSPEKKSDAKRAQTPNAFDSVLRNLSADFGPNGANNEDSDDDDFKVKTSWTKTPKAFQAQITSLENSLRVEKQKRVDLESRVEQLKREKEKLSSDSTSSDQKSKASSSKVQQQHHDSGKRYEHMLAQKEDELRGLKLKVTELNSKASESESLVSNLRRSKQQLTAENARLKLECDRRSYATPSSVFPPPSDPPGAAKEMPPGGSGRPENSRSSVNQGESREMLALRSEIQALRREKSDLQEEAMRGRRLGGKGGLGPDKEVSPSPLVGQLEEKISVQSMEIYGLKKDVEQFKLDNKRLKEQVCQQMAGRIAQVCKGADRRPKTPPPEPFNSHSSGGGGGYAFPNPSSESNALKQENAELRSEVAHMRQELSFHKSASRNQPFGKSDFDRGHSAGGGQSEEMLARQLHLAKNENEELHRRLSIAMNQIQELAAQQRGGRMDLDDGDESRMKELNDLRNENAEYKKEIVQFKGLLDALQAQSLQLSLACRIHEEMAESRAKELAEAKAEREAFASATEATMNNLRAEMAVMTNTHLQASAELRTQNAHLRDRIQKMEMAARSYRMPQ